MNIFDTFTKFSKSLESKLQELEELKKDLEKKGYTHLWQIPDQDPDKERWIKLMKDLGVPVEDPSMSAKTVNAQVVDEPELQLYSSLDCCKDPDCELCGGSGYIVPKSARSKK